jgi:hypothetical protein
MVPGRTTHIVPSSILQNIETIDDCDGNIRVDPAPFWSPDGYRVYHHLSGEV